MIVPTSTPASAATSKRFHPPAYPTPYSTSAATARYTGRCKAPGERSLHVSAIAKLVNLPTTNAAAALCNAATTKQTAASSPIESPLWVSALYFSAV